ncbi:hypothetical protein I317_00787 [Kwoniella heveanensis CBS 569]|nr:hypothetical protein I317_00787 [Kwoniella heveanensis CBS 569]
MPPRSTVNSNNPWNRRVRRLFWLVGTASTVWFVSSYIVDRLKEARVKALKEKKQKDLMKNHFTSLISTISFTLYALLPTLQPQVFEAYPVEGTSQALQGISNPSSLEASTSSLDQPSSPPARNGPPRPPGSQSWNREGSLLSQQEGSTQSSPEAGAGSLGAESWASEFTNQRRLSEDTQETEMETETESEVMLSSVGGIETDDGMSSVASQSISLPPTDTSSASPSPPSPSDLTRSGQFHPQPSPPRVPAKSKKELWRDLKIQSLTRTLTTIYILPMLYLLTSSQLSILARQRYMTDIKSSLPPNTEGLPTYGVADADDDGSRTPRRQSSSFEAAQSDPSGPAKTKGGWFSSFSVDSMGLSEFVESSASLIPNPLSVLPTSMTSYLPAIIAPSSSSTTKPSAASPINRDSDEILAMRQAEEDSVRAEAERLFLTYSWWLLNEGWRSVGKRVEESVEKIFGNMPLKRELSMQDWEMRFKEVRAEVEMELSENSTIELYDFTPHILPDPASASASSSTQGIPFPLSPSDHSVYLSQLVQETRDHILSPDGRYLIEKGISTLLGSLLASLKGECYPDAGVPAQPVRFGGAQQLEQALESKGDVSRRLVDCLPGINTWGKSVWEGIPDSGVEAMLSVHEFEGFAALVFGDWAPKFQ